MGEISRDLIRAIAKTSLPFVFLDFYDPSFKVDSIVSDSAYGSFSLTQHLIDKGLKNIAFVGSIASTSSIMPVLRPAIATVCIIKGVAFYNEYYIPSLYWSDHYVISTYLDKMVGAFGTSWGAVSAAAVIAIVPTIIIFLLLQNQIYSGLTNGAVKS